jgi:hypothetical protein
MATLVAPAPAEVQRYRCANAQGRTSMTLAVARNIFYRARRGLHRL